MGTAKEIRDFLGFAEGASAEAAPPSSVTPPALGGAKASLGGAYEGADRTSRRVASWRPSNRSADMDILPNKYMSDARAKDLVRNDALIQGGAMIHKDSIVGSSYTLNCRPNWRELGLSEEWAETFAEEVESKFTLWAESPNNWVDAGRKKTLTEMIRLAVGIDLTCGEVLASCEWIKGGNRPYSTAIQFIDIDRLSNPTGQANSKFLRGGVARNLFGPPGAPRRGASSATGQFRAYAPERISTSRTPSSECRSGGIAEYDTQ